MKPSEFFKILVQNPKVNQSLFDAAMKEFGWRIVTLTNGILLHDGDKGYFHKMDMSYFVSSMRKSFTPTLHNETCLADALAI